MGVTAVLQGGAGNFPPSTERLELLLVPSLQIQYATQSMAFRRCVYPFPEEPGYAVPDLYMLKCPVLRSPHVESVTMASLTGACTLREGDPDFASLPHFARYRVPHGPALTPAAVPVGGTYHALNLRAECFASPSTRFSPQG